MNQPFQAKGLRFLLIEHPYLNGEPIFRSIRELASVVASLEGTHRFAGKPSSASAAISAVLRGERPFTKDVKQAIEMALEKRLEEASPETADKINKIFARFETRIPYLRTSASDSFQFWLEEATETYIFITCVSGMDFTDEESFRSFIIYKLGLCGSSNQDTARLKGNLIGMFDGTVVVPAMKAIDSSDSAILGNRSIQVERVTLIFPSMASAKYEMLRMLQDISDRNHNAVLDYSEKLEVNEAVKRLRFLFDLKLLRVIVVDPTYCTLPVAVLDPGGLHGSAWIGLASVEEKRLRVVRLEARQTHLIRNTLIQNLETDSLQGQKIATLEELNLDSLATQVSSVEPSSGPEQEPD